MAVPPAANARDGERGRVVVDADADPALVLAPGRRPRRGWPGPAPCPRSRGPAPARAALGPPLPPAVLEVPRPAPSSWCPPRSPARPGARCACDLGVDVLELGVAVGVPAPFERLAVGLQAVPQRAGSSSATIRWLTRDAPARATRPPAAARSCRSTAAATPDPPASSARSAAPSPSPTSDPGPPCACARRPGAGSAPGPRPRRRGPSAP